VKTVDPTEPGGPLLVDASVWVAIVDPVDPFREDAQALAGRTAQPTAILDLTLYEIANVVGARNGFAKQARDLNRLVLERCDRLIAATPELLDDAVEIAAEHSLTAYDAAYVAAARRHGMTLVSCDLADLVSKGLAIAPDAAV
jgi:predicted nucleic acid-binding protein